MASKTLRATITDITPAKARALLRHNNGNRDIRDRHVDHLTEIIERGDWRLTWDAIAVDANGNMQNGQHRLEALIKSDTTCTCLLVIGMSSEAMDVGDE